MSILSSFSSSENGQKKAKNVLLISVYEQTKNKPVCLEHLNELELLAETYGLHVAERIACPIRKYDAATYLGSGKLEELLKIKEEKKVDLVIFDDEISPSQQRNLEKYFGVEVIDRTALILAVFEERAETKEAKLQIEWAKLKYMAPRLKRMWTHLSRQAGTAGGGGAYLKGAGEKQIEVDKRILKTKLSQLEKEIDEIKHTRSVQRGARIRNEIPTLALIGYTNAGKSTLLNQLTEAQVFVEDKLFATLDPTSRKFTLPNDQEVIVTDTVGFIRKLPHLVVAAFRSTLEESLHADILLHVIDISHPMAYEQAATTFDVLKELNAEKKPIVTLLNKVDICQNPQNILRLKLLYPNTVPISAVTKEGFDDFFEKIMEELKKRRTRLFLRIPQKDYHIIAEILQNGQILEKEYVENDILIKCDVLSSFAPKLQKYASTSEKTE